MPWLEDGRLLEGHRLLIEVNHGDVGQGKKQQLGGRGAGWFWFRSTRPRVPCG